MTRFWRGGVLCSVTHNHDFVSADVFVIAADVHCSTPRRWHDVEHLHAGVQFGTSQFQKVHQGVCSARVDRTSCWVRCVPLASHCFLLCSTIGHLERFSFVARRPAARAKWRRKMACRDGVALKTMYAVRSMRLEMTTQ